MFAEVMPMHAKRAIKTAESVKCMMIDNVLEARIVLSLTNVPLYVR